jgi:hypothetical protein
MEEEIKTKGGARPGAGRKPKDEENRIRDLMKPHSMDAIECLARIVTNSTSKDSDKISAAKLIIAYAYGNPKDTMETTLNVNDFNLKELVAFKQ